MPGGSARNRPPQLGRRGQTSVLGIVLIVGITVFGVTGILIYGATALNDSQDQSEIEATAQAMSQLDSRFSVVALGGADHQQAEVPLSNGESLVIDEDRGWMNVSAWNRTTDEYRYTVSNETLGALVYEKDGTTIAYQGGGVWKRERSGGSALVSPPEFHYRASGGQDPTLTIPVVVLRGSGSSSGKVRASYDTTVKKFPDPGNPDRMNPLEDIRMQITVHSEFYRAWGTFFEQRVGGSVTYNHERKLAILSLEQGLAEQEVRGGVVSTSSGYVLEFGQQALIDSYNSTVGPYGSGQDGARVIAAGDVDLGQGAEIKGDLITGGSLHFSGGGGQRVYGNLTYGDDPPSDPSKIDGDIFDGANPTIPRSVGWLVTARGEEFSTSNDNADPPINNDTLDCTGGCTLTAGQYYLDNLELGTDEELTIDTTSGDVQIYVDGDVRLQQDTSSINVTGTHAARFYVDKDLEIKRGSVTTPGDRASAMWIYMRPGAGAELHDAHFEGVIFGPGTGAQSGVRIKVKNQNEIFGGIVGYIPDDGEDGIGQDDRVHFDEALATADPLDPYSEEARTVTFMHITVNRINVSDG